MNTKHIAELVRNLAGTYDSSHPKGWNQRHDSLMEIANELDQPAPRPLLADAEVGWVCRRRDGKWVQLTKTDRDVIYDGESYPYEYVWGFLVWCVNVNGYWSISTGTHPADIVSCEPLAPEGSAEWAMQMLKLGKRVDLEPYNNQWKLSEPQLKPEPAPFAVGDWVEYDPGNNPRLVQIIEIDGDKLYYSDYRSGVHSHIYSTAVTRKLDPSEVRVKITLEGTVTLANYESFFLKHDDKTCQYTMIRFADLDPDTAKLVRELAGK